MKISLAEMSRVFQGYLKDEKPADRTSCPGIEPIVECALGKVSRKARAGIVSHAANCPECAALFKEILGASRAADTFTAEVEAILDRRTQHQPPHREVLLTSLFRKPAVAVLAGLVMVAIVTLSVFWLRDVSGIRGGQKIQVVLVSPLGASVSRDTIQFHWSSVAPAKHYTLELFDEALRLIWRSGPVMTNTIRPEAETSRGLTPGKSYFWRVTAVRGDRLEVKSRLGKFLLEK
jgi:hypothetical protein